MSSSAGDIPQEYWVSGSPWADAAPSEPAWEVPAAVAPEYPAFPTKDETYFFEGRNFSCIGPCSCKGDETICEFCYETIGDVYGVKVVNKALHWCTDCLQYNWQEMIDGHYTWPE